MAHLIAVILFTVAVATFGLPLDEEDPLVGDAYYPADLGWLFEGGNQQTVERDLSRNVCETEECKKIARVLMESKNDSVDPCENFYEYACGNWAKNNPIPKNKSIWNLLYIVAEKVGNQILEILQEDTKPDDIMPLKLARKLYSSCIDLDGMDRRGLEPLVITLTRGNGWPMILSPEEWDEEQTNWQKVDHYYAHLTGSFSFFYLRLHLDSNSSEYRVSVNIPWSDSITWLLVDDDKDDKTDSEKEDSQEKGSTENPPDKDDEKDGGEKSDDGDDNDDNKTEDADTESEKENSVESAYRVAYRGRNRNQKNVTMEERRAAYRNFVVNVTLAIASARGFPVSEEMIAQDVEDLMDFVKKLYYVRQNGRKSEDDEDGMMTIGEIQEWYDSLEHSSSTSKMKWLNLLSVGFNDANVEIDETLVVHFPKKAYFENLVTLLDETPARTLVNYVHWKVICDVLDATTREMRKLLYDASHFGEESEEPSEDEQVENRKRRCLMKVRAESILGYEYVKRHFNEDNLELARDMIKDIQNEVENQIMQSEWMDNNTREHALNKVQNMNMLVGYPSWYKNSTIVNNYYKGIIVSPSFFENVLTSQKRYELKMLRRVNKQEENATLDVAIDNPAEVNAFYGGNSIIITAADLQGPFFESSRPATINFGIIGLIIGHEINHGFDADNFHYDETGAEALSIMADAYNRRAGCFVEQYNNFTETINFFNQSMEDYGNQTVGENIADSMGLLAVYHAYKNRETRNGRPEQTLPGFEDFSNDQLFFLSFANMWCETVDLKKAVKSYARDSHSPGMLRVLGPLSNSVEFSNAYNCPIGSPMNPAKKCNIWK